MEPITNEQAETSVDGGHLASAQARSKRDVGGWAAFLPEPPAGPWRYRFHANQEGGRDSMSDWFYTRTATWTEVDASAVNLVGTPGGTEVRGPVLALDDGEEISALRFALPLREGDRVVGFGERFDALDQVGSSLDTAVFEQYKNQGAERKTYLPMPFAHVVNTDGSGWGVHVETNRRAWFDVGEGDTSLLKIEVGVAVPSRLVSRSAISVAIYRGTPTEVLDRFLGDVGKPKKMPSWIFRLWASANEWNTQAEVLRQMDLHEESDIPVGNVVIEAWSDEETFTAFRGAEYEPRLDGRPPKLSDFTFPEDGPWPDPKGMVDGLHKRGIKVHLWHIPLMKMRPHPGPQGKADADAARRSRVLVNREKLDGTQVPYRIRGWWFPLSLMPDLADAYSAAWWTERRRYLVDEVGIDGFKTDGGEHAWGSDLVYRDGKCGAEKNNLFPVGYARAFGDLLESCGKAPVTFSRAGYTGSQAHGAFWAGDENSSWDAFRWSMFAGLSAASSGILYWGWDIAGFSGPIPSAELYVRAMAASTFIPIMQYHSEFNHHRLPKQDRTPWNIAERTGDEALLAEVRDLVHLRERLVDYLAEESELSVDTSRPLMRPLFFDYAGDPQIWEFPLQWMLGSSLLVAPIVTEGGKQDVYLPSGDWVNAWTGETYTGHQVMHNVWPRQQAAVFVRAEDWPRFEGIFSAGS